MDAIQPKAGKPRPYRLCDLKLYLTSLKTAIFVVDDLEDMLKRGCEWLDDYLATRPDLRKEICPDNK
ncbi:MAG: hypothetical protein RMY34_22625 [Aulosira sp. DedQUE10]|nr:hypothetical protein [Aulosira sp. DedQUE10]